MPAVDVPFTKLSLQTRPLPCVLLFTLTTALFLLSGLLAHEASAEEVQKVPARNAPKKKKRKRIIKKLIHNAVKAIKKDPKRKRKLNPRRFELGLLPAVNYSTDTGFGFGVIGTLVKFRPGFYPYRWRLQFLLYATVQDTGNGAEFPYHDDYVRLDFPGLAGGLLRINAKFGFARFTTAGYYGIGNNSPYEEPWAQYTDKNTGKVPDNLSDDYNTARRYQQYDRIYPNARVNGRFKLIEARENRLEAFVGGRFTYNWINIYDKSKLKADLQGASGPFARSMLIGTSNHGELMGNMGLIWDTRDNEYVPRKGFFHDISARTGGGLGLPFAYGGINATLRFFFSIWEDYFVIAARVIGDMLFGRVPFYELSSFGGLFPGDGPGGSSSVRGVATLRYHGKAKLIGNLELRFKVLPFKIATQRFNLGFIAFFDAGRVWTDYSFPNEETRSALDGDGPGIKYGVGGGIRLQWGETFIVRLDLAQSISDNRFGFYLNINHIF